VVENKDGAPTPPPGSGKHKGGAKRKGAPAEGAGAATAGPAWWRSSAEGGDRGDALKALKDLERTARRIRVPLVGREVSWMGWMLR
jgi:hypothetical protein